jgi:hypothetical protein
MAEKKKSTRTYESEVMALPPLKMVLGDVPDPDVNQPNRSGSKMDRKMESAVQKLISHLKDAKL